MFMSVYSYEKDADTTQVQAYATSLLKYLLAPDCHQYVNDRQYESS